jgi:hypothetical protein
MRLGSSSSGFAVRMESTTALPGIPQPARLGGACVHVGRGEGDLAEKSRMLAEILRLSGDALLRDGDGHADQLERLRQADAAQLDEERRRCPPRSTASSRGRRTTG